MGVRVTVGPGVMTCVGGGVVFTAVVEAPQATRRQLTNVIPRTVASMRIRNLVQKGRGRAENRRMVLFDILALSETKKLLEYASP